MKTWIHVFKRYRVKAMDDATCWEIIKRYYPSTYQYHWRDVTNHPAAEQTFIQKVQL